MATRYDACLDSYEPGETEAYVDSVFNPLKEKLIALLAVAKKNQAKYVLPPLKAYPVEKQELLGRKMLEVIHYDMAGGASW
jgi:Zn-dependent M32 family carboxypeptidase